MGIIFTIIKGIIFAVIMYKCCERFEYKKTWAVMTVLLVVFQLLTSIIGGYFEFALLLKALVIYALGAAILTFLYYKIYESTNSLVGFIIASVVIQLLLSILW